MVTLQSKYPLSTIIHAPQYFTSTIISDSLCSNNTNWLSFIIVPFLRSVAKLLNNTIVLSFHLAGWPLVVCRIFLRWLQVKLNDWHVNFDFPPKWFCFNRCEQFSVITWHAFIDPIAHHNPEIWYSMVCVWASCSHFGYVTYLGYNTVWPKVIKDYWVNLL